MNNIFKKKFFNFCGDNDNYNQRRCLQQLHWLYSISFQLNYLIETKLALSPPELILTSDEEDAQKENIPYTETDDQEFVNKAAEKIKKTLLFAGSSVSASIAAQKRLFPSVPKEQRGGNNNTHPVSAASPYFDKLVKLGLGHVKNYQHPVNKRRSVLFLKRKLEDMPEQALQVVKKLKINEEQYEKCFSSPLKTVDNLLNDNDVEHLE